MASKNCCMCSADVSNQKRHKDVKGNYYCDSCYTARVQQRPAGSEPDLLELSDPVPVTPKKAARRIVEEPPEESGELDLASPIKAHGVGGGAAASGGDEQVMFACAMCKKIVSESQIKNDDGEFICVPCFGKRHKAAAAPAGRALPRKADKDEIVDENPETWKDTLVGGLVISGIVLVVSMVVFAVLRNYMPVKGVPGGWGWAIFFSILQGVFTVINAFGLLLSMIIAGRILGGIDFGYIGSAFWKSLAVITIFNLGWFFGGRVEGLFMILLGCGEGLLILTFIVAFRIDYFEAFLLSTVNFFLFIGLTAALIFTFYAFVPAMPERELTAAEQARVRAVEAEFRAAMARQGAEHGVKPAEAQAATVPGPASQPGAVVAATQPAPGPSGPAVPSGPPAPTATVPPSPGPTSPTDYVPPE